MGKIFNVIHVIAIDISVFRLLNTEVAIYTARTDDNRSVVSLWYPYSKRGGCAYLLYFGVGWVQRREGMVGQDV